jgi:hypothetical protein
MAEENTARPLPPIKLAFIIDNVVTDVLHTDERLAAIFLSDPLIIDVTERTSGHDLENIVPNAIYDPENYSFTHPDKVNVTE